MLRINFPKLTTRILGNLANRTLATAEPYKTTLLKDNPLYGLLETQNNSYQEVVIKNTYSGLGDPVAAADLDRDGNYRFFRRTVQGMAGFTGTAKGQAAASLLAIIDEVGDVRGLSYAEQNIVMQMLIKRLDTPESTTLINAVGLLDEYQALKQSQTVFEKISSEQTEANSGLRQQASASGIRRNLELALRDLYSLVSAMKNVGEWRTFYYDLNQLLSEARHSNRPEKPEPTVEPGPSVQPGPSPQP